MPFIDKVKKNDVEYDIHDTTGRVRIDGASLTIPEQESTLEPVAKFDGVKYYHKQEFDLLDIFENAKEGYTYFDLVTGETFVGGGCSYLSILNNSGAPGRQAELVLNMPKRFFLYATSPYGTVDYTSRAFICVDTPKEVTDNTKIKLPECSAYYGFLSEDGNTFISYYNLKTDEPTFVDSVKQGENDIEIHDPRLENEIATVDARITEEIAEAMAQMPKLPEISVTLSDNDNTCTFIAPASGQLLFAKTSSGETFGIISRRYAYGNTNYAYSLFRFDANIYVYRDATNMSTHTTGQTVTLTKTGMIASSYKHTMMFFKGSDASGASIMYRLVARTSNKDEYTKNSLNLTGFATFYVGNNVLTSVSSPVRIKRADDDMLFVFLDENDNEISLSLKDDFFSDTVTSN